MESSVTSICQLLTQTGLVPANEVQDLHQRWQKEAGPAAADARKFADWLVANQCVTAYQADRLLRGQTDHYFFNQYKLLDRIGAGRMAGIFKAVHRLGQVVAIKVLPPNRAKDPVAFGRFQREARLAMRLKHPNIVRTFQTGVADKIHYLVMEYLDGETLEEVLKRRSKLPPAEAVRLFHQAFQGLQHLHEQGMVHRDLKPANLMLVPARGAGQPDTTLHATLKILDIGVGRALFDEGEPAAGNQELTAAGDLLGSPDYMAPEQARDAHTADIRADIYGLGCVFYHTLTGQPPFPESNMVKKIMKHAMEKPRPLKDFNPAIPDGLQTILNQMMAKDPAQRYQTPAQAAQALQAFLAGGAATEKRSPADQGSLEAYESWLVTEDPDAAAARPPASRGPGPARPRAGVWQRHSRKILAGAGVVAFGLLCWLSVSLFNRHEQPKAGPVAAPGTPSSSNPSFSAWLKQVAALPPEQQAEAVASKLKERNPGFDGQVKHQVQDGAVMELEFVSDRVTDLSPVRALPALKRLSCAGSAPGQSQLADLSPLADLSLAILDCSSTRVADLSPLNGMPLIFISIAGTQVRDLAPLAGAPLVVVNCAGTQVNDLSALRGKKLTLLDAADAPVDDLSPLDGMPLEALWCEIQPQRDAQRLRAIATLKEINGKPASELWKVADAQQKTFDAWVKQTAKLPADKQLAAVIARLKEGNPGFDGEVKSKIERNAVVELRFVCDRVSDISPLRALPGLQRLFCNGSAPGKGKLANLQPLNGLRLTELDCGWSEVRDLTPLQGMRLTRLSIAGNPGISDLEPLQGMPLTYLQLNGSSELSDLSPLQGMKLTALHVADSLVRDLSPLRGLKLATLVVHHTPVNDLGPVQAMPLKTISCDFKPQRDAAVLRSIKTLDRINNRPAAEFWKEVDARQQALAAFVKKVSALPADEQVKAVIAELQKRNPGFDGKHLARVPKGTVTELAFSADQITDLTPLQALPGLNRLTCGGSAAGKGKLADLWPLKGLPLKGLVISATAVSDLSALQGMALEELDIADTPVNDLAPIQKMPIARLNITHTPIDDLSPLKGLPLREVTGDFDADNLAMLRTIQTVTTINGKPLNEAKIVVAARPRPVRGNSKSPREQAKATTRFTGKLIKINHAEKTLTVQIAQSIIVQNPYHAQRILDHQVRLALAARNRNPAARMRAIQDNMFWIAYHQERLLRRIDQKQDLDLKAAEDAKTRTMQTPSVVDSQGNPRKLSAQEIKELKGSDPRVPGFPGNFDELKVPQMVEVYLALPSSSTPPNAPKPAPQGNIVDPRLRVLMVVILQ